MTGFAELFRRLLDEAASAGDTIDFWWRDDDAVAATPALDDLLDAADRHGVPIALAVIPQSAGADLARRLEAEPGATVVVQHGWAHVNHAPAGEKAAELGDHRPADVVLAELAAGRERLADLFGDRFVPMLTPPWNRIGETVAARRGEAGLPGLSTFAHMHANDRACINTHVDIVDWKRGRVFAGGEKMLKVLAEEIAARRADHASGAAPSDTAPIGLLTHHLVHDDGCRDFIEAFLSVAARHPAARWPAVRDIFPG